MILCRILTEVHHIVIIRRCHYHLTFLSFELKVRSHQKSSETLIVTGVLRCGGKWTTSVIGIKNFLLARRPEFVRVSTNSKARLSRPKPSDWQDLGFFWNFGARCFIMFVEMRSAWSKEMELISLFKWRQFSLFLALERMNAFIGSCVIQTPSSEFPGLGQELMSWYSFCCHVSSTLQETRSVALLYA